MAKIFDNGRVLGLLGVLAAVAFIVSLFAAAFTTEGFQIGVEDISKLHSGTIYMAGCIIAGLLGIVYGAGLILRSKGGAVISKVHGILFAVTAAVLVAMVALEFMDIMFWVFFGLVCATILSGVADNWISEQKIMMILSAFLLIVIIATGATHAILGFAFPFLVAVWVLLVSFILYAEVAVPETVAKPKKADKAKKTEKKKADVAKTADKKKAEPKKAEPKKEEPKKAEPKKAEPKKEEPKKVEPVKAEPAAKPEAKPAEAKTEELPKLKVMSSRNAAVVRETVKEQVVVKDEPKKVEPAKVEPPKAEPAKAEPVKVEPAKVEPPKAEPAKVEPVKVEPAKVEPVEEEFPEEPEFVDADEDFEGDFEIAEDTPDALVRRAAWNKGLRCRRDYGEYNIPVAFVKGKVAVYVLPEKGDTSVDEKLKAEGWTVIRYLESEITDGKDQGEEIAAAVKENLKLEKASKKKKKPAKK